MIIEMSLNINNYQTKRGEQKLMQQSYSAQKSLQNKLMEVQQKLTMITKSYMKLKELLNEKDEQIRELKIENHRISKMQEHKQNSYLAEIRKKYQIDGQRHQKMERLDTKMHHGYNVDPVLRMAKSLSPQMKTKTDYTNFAQNYRTNSHYPELKQPEQDFDDFLKNRTKTQEPIITSSSPQNNPSKLRLSIFDDKDNVKESLRSPKDRRVYDSEGIILQQLWQQRDRQIKRMDQLFENLNKRINKQA